MSEADILRACLGWLLLKGFYVWRQNNTGIYDHRSGGYRFHGKKGISDILGVLNDGRFLAIEVKQPGKSMTEAQQEFQQAIADRGGVAICVHSVDELEADFREAGLL